MSGWMEADRAHVSRLLPLPVLQQAVRDAAATSLSAAAPLQWSSTPARHCSPCLPRHQRPVHRPLPYFCPRLNETPPSSPDAIMHMDTVMWASKAWPSVWRARIAVTAVYSGIAGSLDRPIGPHTHQMRAPVLRGQPVGFEAQWQKLRRLPGESPTTIL